MKRLAFGFVLAVGIFSLACDRDPLGLPGTGTITIQVISPTASQASLVEPSGSSVISSGSEIDSLGSPDHRVGRLDAATQTASSVLQLPGVTANAAFDAARVTVVGATNKSVNLTLNGSNWEGTVDSLLPGTYTVIAEGLVGGDVDFFGQTGNVTVVVGENATATISNFASFVPVMSVFTGPTHVFGFTATFSAVGNAESYVVEWDSDASFPNPQSMAMTATSGNVTVADTGAFYVRASSVNSNASATGRWSTYESIRVSTDLDSSGTQATPWPLGFGNGADTTLARLNVFPVSDEDWFSVRSCKLDTLFVLARTVSATPGSALTAQIRVWDSTGVAIDSSNGSDPQAISVLPTDGPYDIQVMGTGGTLGNYELAVDARPGPFNSGTDCTTPTTMAFAVQPTTAVAGAAIAPSVEVWVRDPQGAVATSFTGNVTVAITTGTGTAGATLSGTLTKAAVAGVATFNDLSIDSVGTGYTLTATAAGFADDVGTGFAIQPGPAAALAFVTNPTNAQAGVAVSPSVTVAARDALGNLATSFTGNVAVGILSGTGTTGAAVSGTLTRAAVAGVVTFNDLSIDSVGTAYALVVTSAGVSWASSTIFDIQSGPAATIHVAAEPTTAVAGAAVSPAVQILARDASGNLATTFTGNVTVAITAATGTTGAALSGTLTQAAVAGIATFNDLSIDSVGTGYTLTATSGVFTDAITASFDITPGVGASLDFTVDPTTAVAGVAVSPSVEITARDSQGNVAPSFTGSVTVAITTASGTAGAAISGTLTQSAVAGIATFNDLNIDSVGTAYTLTASGTGLTDGTSAGFDITAGPAASLDFSVDPVNAAAGIAVSPSVEVSARDALGNVATAFVGNVTVAITTGSGTTGATLSGTLTQTAATGVATFNDLWIDSAGTSYALNATATGLTTATSAVFDIAAGLAATVDVTPKGASLTGIGANQGYIAQAWDIFGNVIPSPTVTWTTLNGAVATINASGQATSAGDGQSVISAQVDTASAYAMATVNVAPAAPVNIWADMTHPAAGLDIWGVWGSSASEAFAVGPNTAMRYASNTWTLDGDPGSGFLIGMGGTSATDVYASGTGIVHWDGGTWGAVPDPTGGGANNWGVWSAAPNEVYSVSTAGGVYRYDGASVWDTLHITVQPLYGVWGTASNDIYAVGNNGTLVHYDGGTWTETANIAGFTATLTDVWGTSPSDVFAAGCGGILHYDGGSWTNQAPGLPGCIWHISGSAPDDVYGVGDGGLIVHYDGVSWKSQGTHPAGFLAGVWSTAAGDPIATGTNGTVLRGIRGGSVVITPAVDTLIAAMDTVQLTADVKDAAAAVVTGSYITWTSSDVAVATVDVNGLVTATGGGTVQIVGMALGGAADTMTVVVASTGDLVVINDLHMFLNYGMEIADNMLLVQNLAGLTSSGLRDTSSVVIYDYGRSSTRFGTLDSVTVAFQNAGMTVDSISSASGNLVGIPGYVKVLMLWLPTVAYTAPEIAALQQFMREGGRVVFIGDKLGTFTAPGVATQNQFLLDMGSGMSNGGGVWLDGWWGLVGPGLRDYQVTTGLTDLRIAEVGDLSLSPGDRVMLYDPTETGVFGAVARVMLY